MAMSLGIKYTKMFGLTGRAVFDLTAADRAELIRFFEANKDAVERKTLDDDELEKLCVTLPETKWELAKSLIYRHNLTALGQQQEAEKKEFLDQFAMEAVKGIIHGSDFCPTELTVDQYAGAVMAAREEYGDSVLFAERIVNVAGPKNHLQMRKVADQIDMFSALFNVPFADELGESVPQEQD
jgi:hypothetical protein